MCLDQQNNLCARFLFSRWAMKILGKFVMGPFVNGVLMDEIIVTGMAILEAQRRSDRDTSG